MKAIEERLKEVLDGFEFGGKPVLQGRYGNGHINFTYLIHVDFNGTTKRMILQQMNKDIFKKPVEVMENILGVTSYLGRKIAERGGNPERETLNIACAKDGKPYFVDSEGEYWRVYHFIEGATCYDQVASDEDFYQSGYAFGNFQCLLADYPADTLHETIPQFHDTVKRFADFKRAVQEDVMGRAALVQREIEFALAREKDTAVLGNMLAKGELPLRVTHNDTKLNNIMIDDETRKGICVIDLDTVMPGLSVHDFGDSIRFGASTATEDEKDLDKVSCSMHLLDVYNSGFQKGCQGRLTEAEIEMLPMGAKMMTYECGIRFLADYLEGDHYFQIHREGHNLDRARTQFKLVADMEKKWDEMLRIVRQ
ncbi:phosphotransferase enzyme family protein [Mediterraneibacter agrestimuris]|uniref:phosphotransferase enzyme family protein n=1 Tax=Mediterraneibacter agrestimuris TaxID=2941333 RepID=UPI00203C282C|nr:aminoglycoside phosphotransferase family protein [Mediterraneibacter agrestimuris]